MPYIQYETLFELYIQKQWTQQAIADALNCSVHRVRQSKGFTIHQIAKRWQVSRGAIQRSLAKEISHALANE